jgi:hypothetical protein
MDLAIDGQTPFTFDTECSCGSGIYSYPNRGMNTGHGDITINVSLIPVSAPIDVPVRDEIVFIVRRDVLAVQRALSERLGGESKKRVHAAIAAAYPAFERAVFEQIARGLRGNEPTARPVRIDVYDPEELEALVREKAENSAVISLDPLLCTGPTNFSVSRLFNLSGTLSLGMTHRPGSPAIAEQVEGLRKYFGDRAVVLVDDDLFSGGTAQQAISTLGLNIDKFLPQIKAGEGRALVRQGVTIDPIVNYEISENSVINIGDVRDFLLGASGLVVALPSGELGRTPYCLPFLCPGERASVLPELTSEFSCAILASNYRFYRELENLLGFPICLQHGDPSFARMMEEVYDFSPSTPLSDVVIWALNGMEEIRGKNLAIGALQGLKADGKLPERAVFVDVNGTLIPADASSFNLCAEDRMRLTEVVKRLEEKGVAVGLCSDSPLAQLKDLANELKISGPMLAENGNRLDFGGTSVNIRELSNLAQLREKVIRMVPSHYRQLPDCVAPEFGGKEPAYERGEWAFGANRTTAISMFAPAELVSMLAEILEKENGLSLDASPEHNYLGIHPGRDFRHAKGMTLSLLKSHMTEVWMIGDSLSDWVDPSSEVYSIFVANARVPEQTLRRARLATGEKLVGGVIDLLEQIDGIERPAA